MAVTPNSIVTPQAPKSAIAIAATAQATFPPTTAPSNTVLLVTFGTNGGRLTRLEACPQETTTANNCQMYRCIDGVGTVKYLAKQLTLTSTVSATAGASNGDFGFSDDNPYIGQPNERIYVAVGVAKNVAFVAEWADY